MWQQQLQREHRVNAHVPNAEPPPSSLVHVHVSLNWDTKYKCKTSSHCKKCLPLRNHGLQCFCFQD